MNVPPEGGGGPPGPQPGAGSGMTVVTTMPLYSPAPASSSPAMARSPATSPARKRLKLDLSGCSTANPATLKRKLFEWRTARLRRRTSSYRDNMAELFFLHSGTNVTDSLPQFRKKPSQQFVDFLVSSEAPARVISEVQTAVLGPGGPSSGPLTPASNSVTPGVSSSQPLKRPSASYSPHVGVLSPVKVGSCQDTYTARVTASRPAPASSIPPPSAPVYSRDQVGERIKQEGWVVRRVAELSRDGLWPARRLPQVAERPRPISAWDLVLEEMRWMATDFAQERSWKKAAARVQSAACREHVIRRQEQEQVARLEMNSEAHKKMIARKLAEKVETFWKDVESCYEYEATKRRELHLGASLAQQSCIVSEQPPLKRRHSGTLVSAASLAAAPLTPESQHENGVTSDSESTISEQEAWELRNTVRDNEISDLGQDAATPLLELVSGRYPGYEEDLRLRWEEASSEDVMDGISDWDTDSDCDMADPAGQDNGAVSLATLLDTSDRTSAGGGSGDCLLTLSSKASLLSPSVITSGSWQSPGHHHLASADQQAGLQWLVSTQVHSLPGLLLGDPSQAAARRLTVASLLALLPSLGPAAPPCPGPHLVICPVSSLAAWTAALASAAPALTVTAYTGTPRDRRRRREEIFLSYVTPDIVITTYRTFFLDADWFLTRSWSLLVLSEIQNVVTAGSSEQIRALVSLRSARRTLLYSGQLRETPIDLWNTLYLLFPVVYHKRGENSAEVAVEVEGTPEYTEIQEKLLAIITGFSFQKPVTGSTPPSENSEASVKETKLAVPLNSNKRKLYDDYLAQTLSHQDRDLRVVCNAIQSLREICNEIVEPRSAAAPGSGSGRWLPDWCYLDKRQPAQWSNIQHYRPLDNISLDQINLVFLSQEMTTTVVTSARLRSIKASKKMIQELSSEASTAAPPVPRHKFQLGLESLTRNIGGGWRLGAGDTAASSSLRGQGQVTQSLVKAANGQVYRMSVADAAEDMETGGEHGGHTSAADSVGAFHPDSLDTIASVNHWRCDGFPLYGQDLVRSLTITNTVRPLRSRFRGQGHVNCLNTGAGAEQQQDWRYSTRGLASLCSVAAASLATILRTSQPRDTGLSDNKMKALHNVIYPGYKEGKKIVVVTGLESLVPAIAAVCNKSGIRYCCVRPCDSLARQQAAVARWRLEPRLSVLVLAGSLDTANLELGVPGLVVVADTGPGHWPQQPSSLGCPLVRLVASGTVEEGLTRVETVRRIMADIKTKSDNMVLSKQTVTDILSPTPDNGYTKKKEKSLSESEENVWNVLSTFLGSSADPVQSLLDLAELGTSGEIQNDGFEDLDEEAVELVQWLQGIEPVKRYGMRLLRDNVDIRVGRVSCAASEVEDTEARKLAWEQRLAEQLAREAREERDEDLLSYTRDLADRAWRSEDGLVSEVWRPRGQLHTPDTVPPDTTWAGYSREIIPDTQLPPVHVKKEKKAAPAPIPGVICQPMSPPTLALSPSHPSVQDTSKTKIKREDQPAPAPPKSLFDRPRPPKMVARRPMASLQSSSFQSSSLSSAVPSLSSQFQSLKPDAGPEWSPAEDWALHQAVTSTQELSLAAVSALGHSGHTVNWDLVSDMVCSVSYCYRPAKQCRARWEASLVPREEGRLTYDTTPKKLKKDKKLGMKLDKKSLGPGSHSMKTGALFRADNNNAISSTFSSRFETIKSIANKRTPTNTPLLVNPTLRNPKHAAVLAESGVDYDAPVSPVQVAASRAERIQASKARSAQLSAGAAAATPQLPTQPQLPQSPVPTAAGIRTSGATAAVSLPSQPAQAVVVGISQPLQGAVLQTSGGVTRPAQQSVQQTVTALSVQDLLKTVSTSGGVAAITTAAAAAGSSAGSRLTSGQILVTQAGKSAAGQSGAVQVANQRLTPHQLAQLKQQAIQKRAAEQQKQRLAAAANTVTAGASSAATAVSGAAAVVTTAAAAGTSKLTVTGAVPGVAAAIGRGQMINRQNIRNITDPEFKALLAKQSGAVKVGQGGVVQVSANSMSAAQLQQLGIQVATSSAAGGQGGTLVKTVSAPAGVQVTGGVAGAGQPGTSKPVTIAGVPAVNLPAGQLKAVTTGRGTAIKGSPQQIQQLQLQQQLKLLQQKGLQGQRVALSTGGKGLPTQLIVPGGNKGLPAAVTVQQLQQIVKGAGLAGGQGQVLQGQQILSHVVKPGGQTVQARVIPVSGGAGRGQQTIQVVTATPQRQGGAPNVTINQMGRGGGVAGELTAGNNIKIQVPQGASQQQILSQISTALAGAGHGQNVSVAVRTQQPPAAAQQPAAAGSGATAATVLQPATAVVAAGQQQQQMVNLQLSVANPVQQQQQPQPQPQAAPAGQQPNTPQPTNNSDV